MNHVPMPNMNFTREYVADTVEKLRQGFSGFIVNNSEKYQDLVSRLDEGDSVFLQLTGLIAFTLYSHLDLIGMYIHLILAALFPILIGAFSSLSRPSSAGKPIKTSKDDPKHLESAMETLGTSDALMFPLMAGIMLSALYLLLTSFDIAQILNKLMGLYFSAAGVFAVAKLASDGLNVMTTMLFPGRYVQCGKTYHLDRSTSRFIAFDDETDVQRNPIPKLRSTKYTSQLWKIRALLTERFTVNIQIRRIFTLDVDHLRLTDVLGFAMALAVILLHNIYGSWMSMNVMGFSFCYAGFLLMSPTTFSIGSLLLMGLFFYDIVMVFYTPMMVKVATSLDIPIKLIFPGPKRGSMLGLGDIVLPGLMICLALRFDLHLHYLRKQTVQDQQTIKAPYVDVTGKWGDYFWTRDAPPNHRPETFPKVYFKASIIGYVVGLVATLICLNIFQHAQPALLYLVPGVLISLWTTALVRRELGLMWSYSEAAQIGDDEKQPIQAKKASSGVVATDNHRAAKEKASSPKKKSHYFVYELDMDESKIKTARDSEKEGVSSNAADSSHFFSFSVSNAQNKVQWFKAI